MQNGGVYAKTFDIIGDGFSHLTEGTVFYAPVTAIGDTAVGFVTHEDI